MMDKNKTSGAYNMTSEELLKRRAEHCKIDLSDFQLNQFEKYRELIKEWNQKIDITAITDDKEIDEKHFLDSLSLAKLPITYSGKKLIDIGTGGGFPGIPIKIWEPSIKLTLLDSLNKRIIFLDEVIKNLKLNESEAIHARAEETFRDKKYREKYDIAVSRAVAPLPTLLEYCLPAVKKGGLFIAMKGPGGDEELKLAENAIEVLGGAVKSVGHFVWTESEYERTIIIIEKIKGTPKVYPRGQGKPRKNPL